LFSIGIPQPTQGNKQESDKKEERIDVLDSPREEDLSLHVSKTDPT